MHFPGFLSRNDSNLLPQDGILEYFYPFYDQDESLNLFRSLLAHTKWKEEQINIFGKISPIPRLTAWYGDSGKTYTYSRIKMNPNPWTSELLSIKQKVESHTGLVFDSLLLNLYRDQNDHVSWHADDEKELGSNPAIASLSFGETRKFQIKHKFEKNIEMITLNLESGSLVVMKAEMQEYWLHRIAPSKSQLDSRINLTFRTIKK